MSVEDTWLTREKWTLVEAALICAGIEPYAGGPATDDPHEVMRRIEDGDSSAVFLELYSRSKDAVGGGLALAERSRTSYVGNHRVWPNEYVRWAFGSLPGAVHERIDWDSLKPVSGPAIDAPLHPDWTQDPYGETHFGYTIEGAARELHERYGVDEMAMQVQLRDAVWRGELLVVDWRTGLRQRIEPRELRDFHSRIRTADINSWLKSRGVDYVLGRQESVSSGDTAIAQASRGPIVKRAILLADLRDQYPLLLAAVRSNDAAFVACRVPPAHAPGNKGGYYYVDEVRNICEAKWARESGRRSVPPRSDRVVGQWAAPSQHKKAGRKPAKS